MIQLRSNRTFSVTRRGQSVASITDLDALCLPARPEIVAMQGAPANKLFSIMVEGLPDIREQDVLISQRDTDETYLVSGVAPFDSPRTKHTELYALKQWGTQA